MTKVFWGVIVALIIIVIIIALAEVALGYGDHKDL
jgi:hypothetical protein